MVSSERTASEGRPIRNQILAGVPHSEFHTLRPSLEVVELPARTSLHNATQRVEFAYFPNRGLVSLVVAMRDGKTVEVGVVGEEGLIGAEGIFGVSRTPYRSVLSQNGEGVRISLDSLRPLLPSLPQFRFMVSRYLVARTLEMAQWAACNRLHTAEQRLARWLLKEVGLHWFDRILGGAFGLVRGGLTAAVILLGFTTFNPQSNWLEGSRLLLRRVQVPERYSSARSFHGKQFESYCRISDGCAPRYVREHSRLRIVYLCREVSTSVRKPISTT